MRILFLALLATIPLHGRDARKLALETAAQADFERVLTGAPDLASAAKCLQSQAMLLAIATPEETPPIVFRKAYCQLANAAATHNRSAIGQAAEMLDEAIADGEAPSAKQKIPFNVPPTWRILASVARLNAGVPPDSQEQSLLRAVNADPGNWSGCQGSAAAVEFCHTVHQLGSAWLGWISLKRGDLVPAARLLANGNAPGWTKWVAGMSLYRQGNYASAAVDYGLAIEIWREVGSDSFVQQMSPRPAMSEALADWGGAQLAANDLVGALGNLDAAVKTDSANARAFYLRGLTKQHLGRNDAAMEDLNLASRAAFAKNGDAAAAEAHLYRGISLYWRKEFMRAEDEFASAMNAGVTEPWQSDVRAWRLLAAVASGACGDSRRALESAMTSISPYFPKVDARAAFAACPTTESQNVFPNRRIVLQFP
jgi:tetratricopeptide (TPR) repeat protein